MNQIMVRERTMTRFMTRKPKMIMVAQSTPTITKHNVKESHPETYIMK